MSSLCSVSMCVVLKVEMACFLVLLFPPVENPSGAVREFGLNSTRRTAL